MSTAKDPRLWDKASRKYGRAAVPDQGEYPACYADNASIRPRAPWQRLRKNVQEYPRQTIG
jgi:hypothetical protein